MLAKQRSAQAYVALVNFHAQQQMQRHKERQRQPEHVQLRPWSAPSPASYRGVPPPTRAPLLGESIPPRKACTTELAPAALPPQVTEETVLLETRQAFEQARAAVLENRLYLRNQVHRSPQPSSRPEGTCKNDAHIAASVQRNSSSGPLGHSQCVDALQGHACCPPTWATTTASVSPEASTCAPSREHAEVEAACYAAIPPPSNQESVCRDAAHSLSAAKLAASIEKRIGETVSLLHPSTCSEERLAKEEEVKEVRDGGVADHFSRRPAPRSSPLARPYSAPTRRAPNLSRPLSAGRARGLPPRPARGCVDPSSRLGALRLSKARACSQVHYSRGSAVPVGRRRRRRFE